MNCKSARRGLSLYLYSELSFDEEELFEQHLEGCEDCRRELEREKAMHQAFDRAEVSPPAELLERCRLELPRTLRHAPPLAREPAGWMERLRGFLRTPAAPAAAWLKPAGAVALVAVGFFTARFTAGPASSLAPSDQVVTRVRHVEPSPSGEVRVVVDETRQRVLTGSLEDASIRQLLLAALSDPTDPGLRAESVDLLGNRPASAEIRTALLHALRNDPNDGVRLKALEGLRSYTGDAESRGVLSQVLLNDDNPGIRTMAIDLLVSSEPREAVGTLQELLRREDNPYVRRRSLQTLRDMNASVETF
jgi:hypothetical protein